MGNIRSVQSAAGIYRQGGCHKRNLSFIITHWQGYVMIVLILLMVIAYVAVELNALIIYCSQLINGEKPSVWQSIKGGFAAMK